MLIKHSVLSTQEIEQFKQYFEKYKHENYTNWTQKDGKPLDIRVIIQKNRPEWQIIERVAREVFPDVQEIWGGYQRQSFPHNIHTDERPKEKPYVYTIVISLDTQDKFKTIVWNEKFPDNKGFHKYLRINSNKKNRTKLTNISESEDLGHTKSPQDQDYICDYLTLDGVYTYEAGSCVVFDARKLHCSNDWTKHKEIPYRELLQIHCVTLNEYNY
jgi:hypothetical protein